MNSAFEDGYMNPKIRKRRGEGVQELYRLVDDISWIEKEVSGLGYLSRKYYRREWMRKDKELDDDYLSLVIECHHQVSNDAYEATIDFNKNPSILRYLRG